MRRITYLGRPPRAVVVLCLAAVAVFAVSVFVLHGTPPGHARFGRGSVPVSRTGPIDIIRIALDVGAIALVLYAVLRWNNLREDAPRADQAERRYGDSIVDARTSVDPAIGMRPVNSEPRRH